MQQLDAFLATLAPGPSQSVADLTIFPLLRQPAPDPWYDTLAEAVAGGTARVTEISESGSVPELRVVNESATSHPDRRRRRAGRRQAEPHRQPDDPRAAEDDDHDSGVMR